MKKLIGFSLALVLCVSSFLFGLKVKNSNHENCIKANEIETIEETESGVLLTYEDGTGFYIEK